MCPLMGFSCHVTSLFTKAPPKRVPARGGTTNIKQNLRTILRLRTGLPAPAHPNTPVPAHPSAHPQSR